MSFDVDRDDFRTEFHAERNALMQGRDCADARAEESSALCARCKREPRWRASRFCQPCVDRCHEATDFAHVCMVCDGPENYGDEVWA